MSDDFSGCEIALVAVDGGARAAIRPLAAYAGFDSIKISASDEKELYEALFSGHYHGLVIGTSDSSKGRGIEAHILRLANSVELPVFAIEDYPGNYHPADGSRADVVIVEGELARKLVLDKQPVHSPDIWVCTPVRYDSLRQRSQELRENVGKRWLVDGERWVLWAGQPETGDSFETMKRFLPVLSNVQGVKLLFKAHPRDAGYLAGAYHDLLGSSGVDFLDVTTDTLEACMEFAPRIVLTQFSSVGVEAGFYGIPAVNILYPDVGGKRLAGKKGYNIPPWAQEGGAFVITTLAGQEMMLDRAINDEEGRSSAIEKFDSYFSASEFVGPQLSERIRQYCANWKRREPKTLA